MTWLENNTILVCLSISKLEYIDEDPKDGELYLGRIKPGETLVEVRRDANVQIARRIWV